MRRSSRIPKEIPVLLIGSDLAGRVFSEPTKTVVLSFHGAGIVSRHKLCPEQELILRRPDANKEAEIRVVGQIGFQSGSYTYGVAFVDPSLDFWAIEFPPLSEADRQAALLSLECSACKTFETIDNSELESDVCATNEGVIRFCKRCGSSTVWRQALGAPLHESAPHGAMQTPESSSSSIPVQSSSLAPAPAASSSSMPAPAQASSYASSPSQATVYPACPGPGGEHQAAVLTMPRPEKPAAPPVNRRKHPRVKVSYSACVRRPGFQEDDIVQCEDMSRGGLRFKSRKRYFEQSFIEVAVPYEPGQPAIFVPAQVVFVAELPEQQFFRCGVAFLKSAKPRDSF